MTFTDYKALPGVNWSTLSSLRDSGLHYQHRLLDGDEDTPAKKMGRVAHVLALDPDSFAADYAIYEGGDRRGKDWAAFKAEHEGQDIFKPDEIETAMAIADAVRRHPLVQPYLDGGLFEQTLEWRDAGTGLRCKGRPDWLVPSRRWLVDLKTARSVDARLFGLSAAKYGYHCQLAHYAAGVEAALGWKPEKVVIVAVENTSPHDVAVFVVDEEEALYAGREEVRELLDKLSVFRSANTWPGRYSEEQALMLPRYLFDDPDAENPDSFPVTFGD